MLHTVQLLWQAIVEPTGLGKHLAAFKLPLRYPGLQRSALDSPASATSSHCLQLLAFGENPTCRSLNRKLAYHNDPPQGWQIQACDLDRQSAHRLESLHKCQWSSLSGSRTHNTRLHTETF